MKTRFARLACAAALLALSVSSATAQNYPARQITLVVPFAPGGPADFLGRLIGLKMGEDLGQQVVIDNRPGANTIIGAQAVAKATPDGYTLLMAIDGTLVMNPFLYSKLRTTRSRISCRYRWSRSCPRRWSETSTFRSDRSRIWSSRKRPSRAPSRSESARRHRRSMSDF
jgi:hypothetical protein